MASNARVLETYALRPEVPLSERLRRGVGNFIKQKPLGAFGAAVVLLLIAMALVPQASRGATCTRASSTARGTRSSSGSAW